MTDTAVPGFPFDPASVLRRQRQRRRELRERDDLADLRVALLGGSTTSELAGLLELFLLERGFRPELYESQYDRYYEEAVLDPTPLTAFAPDFVVVCTSSVNLRAPAAAMTEAAFDSRVHAELERFRAIWTSLSERVGAQVVQLNFEPPALRPLGNADGARFGLSHLALRLNDAFAAAARTQPALLVHDTAALAGRLGTVHWHDATRWFAYKIATTPAASVALAHSLASLIAAARGRSRKALVLDLDNTLWGGVIGDDGLNGIVLGRETGRGEAFLAFQQYCQALRQRGILLAVCSKNDDGVAREAFTHPESLLRVEDFAAFRANWEPKPDNLRAIAAELNIGLDSLVFVDDNPAERALVAAQLPMVAVPDVGSDVTRFAAILDHSGYFEVAGLSQEDLERSTQYSANATRTASAARFADYGAYLDSLQMVAEIGPFTGPSLGRITQLTNKTNQFNLTTRRYTAAEIDQVAASPEYIALQGRLADVFGDNGLISVVIGRRDGDALHLDLWIMSCRVLKRGMEEAMLDALVHRARAAGVRTLVGYFLPTAKNGLVAAHYDALGFSCVERAPDGATRWTLDISGGYTNRNHRIRETTHV